MGWEGQKEQSSEQWEQSWTEAYTSGLFLYMCSPFFETSLPGVAAIFPIFFPFTHSGTPSLRSRELLGVEVVDLRPPGHRPRVCLVLRRSSRVRVPENHRLGIMEIVERVD